MEHKQRFHSLVLSLAALTAVVLLLCLVTGGKQHMIRDNPPQPVSYKIISDSMATTIRIGVEADVDEGQLRATLSKAANDHQDDAARDYLTSMYLSVEAYLMKGDRQSNIPAGRLKRYVPPGNAAERRKMSVDREKDDEFIITLDEAKQTLP